MSDPFTEAHNLLTRGLANGDEPNKPAWPEPITFAEFKREPIEKPRPILENLLDVSSRMIFGGGSKTYKTWAMSDMALSINSGVSWWGFPAFKARCIYINFELKKFYMRKRMVAIELAKKINGASDEMMFLNLRGFDPSLSEFKTQLLELIEKHQILVVFIDPFYRLVGGQDERQSSIINVILAAFDEINRLSGATVVFAAHFTKGNQAGKESIDRISGGGSINRDPDSLITLTKHETDHAFTVDFTLRDFAPVDPFVVQWQYPLLVRSEELDPDKIKRPAATRKREGYTPADLFNLIKVNDDELGTNELVAKVEETLGWSRRTTFTKLEILKSQKKVWLSVASGKWNVKI
jgi:hypothetical protein